MIKIIDNVDIFSQRNNKYSPSVACFPTSAAMALHYRGVKDPYEGLQLEDYLVKSSLSLTDEEKTKLAKENGAWILDHRPFQVIPIMEYVCKKLYENTVMSWGITFGIVKENIDRGNPLVCLGNFSKISYVRGHYNCIIGYNDETQQVIVNDPFGNAHTNYTDFNGSKITYDWLIFCQDGTNCSYGLIFL